MRSPVPSGSRVVFVMVNVYGTVFPVSGNFWSKSVAIEKPLPYLYQHELIERSKTPYPALTAAGSIGTLCIWVVWSQSRGRPSGRRG